MKVVILCAQLEGGGAQRASYKLSNELNNRGNSVENWFFYKKRDNFTGLGKTVTFLDRPIKSKWDNIRIFKNYYKLLRKERPDAVIAFTHYANVLGLFIAFLAGVKIRVASHRNPSWGDMSQMLMKIDNLFAKSGIYTAITAVSKSTKETFRYYPERIFKKIEVINNGLKVEQNTVSKEQARILLGLPKDVQFIGTVGRLSKQKNHRLLFETLQKLDQNVHLAIAGDGELREEALQTIEELALIDRVWLLGELRHDQISFFFKAIDIYTMPSLFEGLSNALVEAMAAGLPVISSNIDAQKDVVISDDGILNGILIDPQDSETWRSEIIKLLSDPEQMKYYSSRSLRRSEDFTIEKMANGFLKVLQDHHKTS